MYLISLIVIILMGSNDWQTRESATRVLKWMADNDILPYPAVLKAINHKDLEIKNRARIALWNRYRTKNGSFNVNYKRVLFSPKKFLFSFDIVDNERWIYNDYYYIKSDGAAVPTSFFGIRVTYNIGWIEYRHGSDFNSDFFIWQKKQAEIEAIPK